MQNLNLSRRRRRNIWFCKTHPCNDSNCKDYPSKDVVLKITILVFLCSLTLKARDKKKSYKALQAQENMLLDIREKEKQKGTGVHQLKNLYPPQLSQILSTKTLHENRVRNLQLKCTSTEGVSPRKWRRDATHDSILQQHCPWNAIKTAPNLHAGISQQLLQSLNTKPHTNMGLCSDNQKIFIFPSHMEETTGQPTQSCRLQWQPTQSPSNWPKKASLHQ